MYKVLKVLAVILLFGCVGGAAGAVEGGMRQGLTIFRLRVN
jgi:hypothetical protein